VAKQTAVNGVRYSFTDLTLEATTAPNFGGVDVRVPKGVVQSINYDAQIDSALVQGNSILPVGSTNGMGTSSGSMELLVSEMDDFFSLITGGGAFPITAVFFDLRIAYSVNGTDVRVDSLRGCRITKIGSSNQKGSDATVKSCDLQIKQVYINGIAAYADPLSV